MKFFLLPAVAIVLLLTACDDHSDKTTTLNKKGGIEVSLSTAHLDTTRDLLTTHYTVWDKGIKVKEFDKRDTIPALGMATTEGEDDNGNNQDITVKKDYEFYVTVK
ncbi:hypothetical protein HDF24_12520 [Mucilaginibacter sp. X4EP1]|jgi:hypothetical protein|uniref:hypothetical protein n=1 Tax=Mucilaginibacter sp. X4EP1 TaxID=2723092 RepID=UPI002168DA22|nr:hypothetical protein [Mucilaginibacter sp. X4EP1]MCS3813082.1 hypothetical protein [Mucilaginibacter sp. X4EP1]